MNFMNMVKRLTPYTIKKGFMYLRHYGLKDFLVRMGERFEETEVDYNIWFREKRLNQEDLKLQTEQKWEQKVVISVVVPIFRTPEPFLRQMIESVINQTYPFWELCIADGSGNTEKTRTVVEEYVKKDNRILYQVLQENLGIADNTNTAMNMASGDYIALFDHDDLLEPDALFEIAEAAMKSQGNADVLYTDEDKVAADLSEYFQPHFKPDFSPDLLRSNNYICHLFVVKRLLAVSVGGQRKEFDGAQDYDFILRCCEQAKSIVHIPKILYHWRVHKASTADNPASKRYAFEAGKRAIEAHLKRMKVTGTVSATKDLGFYRVKYKVQGNPFISIVIPNKDNMGILKRCIDSIQSKSTYRNYEVIIVENNSKEPDTFAYYKSIDGKNGISVIYWEEEFNYSRINNYGIMHAKGDYIVCLNNDISVITPDWMEELLGNCQRKEVGITGARLYFPDNTIQHAGIVVGMGGSAGSMFVGMSRNRTGYMHKAAIQQNLSAVTAACFMVKRQAFEQAGGFDEKLAVAFNDVDFCLRVRQAGYLVVYNPDAQMYHDESKTRGYEDTPEKQARFQKEKDYLRSRWPEIMEQGDPYYNRNLSLEKCDYTIQA